MLRPLDRTQAEYIWAMEQWAAVTTLDEAERSIVRTLLSAAKKSLSDFDAMRNVATQGFFRPTTMSAIEKGRAAGILRKWPDAS